MVAWWSHLSGQSICSSCKARDPALVQLPLITRVSFTTHHRTCDCVLEISYDGVQAARCTDADMNIMVANV